MDQNSLQLLLTPAGQEVLHAAEALDPQEANFLHDFTALSRRYPAELARAALETAILRREAAAKFPQAGRMFFSREALEQASSFEISSYRAERYRPFTRLADLGCSIGGDTLALAAAAPTLGIDLDPLRLALAQANQRLLGQEGRAEFVRADLTRALPVKRMFDAGTLALFFDPARRAGGRRVFSVRDYRPPLAIVQEWLPVFPAVGVKISPGVDYVELGGYPAEVEFISLRGELKEAVLWFGPLKTAERRATLLGNGRHTLANPGGGLPVLATGKPRAVIYEPDPAVLRAGLVGKLGEQVDAVQLDPDIAYLTADAARPTPFARMWAVEDWFPFGLKRLRAYLRERNIGQVVVKKRGSPLHPEALIRDLRLKGDQERVLFLTHLNGRPIVIVAAGPQA